MPNWESFDFFLQEALQTPEDQRQSLVDNLLRERVEWPWITGNHVTFINVALGTRQVAVNLDTLPGDPPFAQMHDLPGTSLWYVTLEFNQDDLLDYMLAVNDPMTPLADETHIVDRITRHWRADPLNPTKMVTTQMTVSVLRMPNARPLPDWSKMGRVPRGKVVEHTISSRHLHFTGRKMWVYTPPNYEESLLPFPMLILHDGQWGVGPLQVPLIADALIKHNQLQPLIIVMIQSGDQTERIKTYVSNDNHYQFLTEEVLPFIQDKYNVTPDGYGIGGVGVGAIAAAHTALNSPSIFTRLMLLSPPLGKGLAQEQLREYKGRFENAMTLPERIFQSVGRYEARARFYIPAQVLNSVLYQRDDVAHKFVELGSGHGLVAFRSVMPEALSWIFPAKD